MSFLLADKNTSAGAPCSICWASLPELPKLYVTDTLLCSFSKVGFNSLSASVKLAAANTITSVLSEEAVSLLALISLLLLPQPARANMPTTNIKIKAIRFNILLPLLFINYN
ncbi:hypothetical protein D1872_293000 [compost metagenome]